MKWKTFLFFTIIILLGRANLALGFGVSPPWVQADHLVPGSHYEQDIYLSQPEPLVPLNIEVVIDGPDIENWIQIKPGKSFTMPAALQYPMRVIIDIPKDAGYDVYQGKIRVRAVGEGGGQVALLTGAIIDVRLGVSGEEYSDFQLKEVAVKNIEEGWPIKVYIKLENLGNVKVRPSKVLVKIYDQYRQKIVQSGEATDMGWVESFKKGEVVAKLSTKLGIGEYWAEIEIFKKGESILKDIRGFKIVPKGTIKPYPIFLGISIYAWAAILVAILIVIIGFKFGFWGKILRKLGIKITIERKR